MLPKVRVNYPLGVICVSLGVTWNQNRMFCIMSDHCSNDHNIGTRILVALILQCKIFRVIRHNCYFDLGNNSKQDNQGTVTILRFL